MRTHPSLITVCILCLGLAPGLVSAQEEAAQEPRPDPCAAEEYRQFDFWVGDWEVRDPDGKVVGHNTIERIFDGCVLKESWRGAEGSVGQSFNTYDRMKEQWHQTWVDANGLLLQLDGGLADGSMVLAGEMPTRAGGVARTRITWTPGDDGSVRQHWEASKDGGETWQTVFDGLYVSVE